MKALKENFREFYDVYRKLLWAATLVLTIPLPLRTLFDLLKEWEWWNTLTNTGDGAVSVYNFFFFLFTTYLPIIFQVSTLVFGFVRNKQGKIFDEEQKKRLQNGEIKDDDSQSNLSDNVSANGSDGSFFDPPIEHFNGGTYGMDSRATSGGIYMKQKNNINPSDKQSMVSDFDASFANRDRQQTPEHKPLKIKNVDRLGGSEVGTSAEFSEHKNSTLQAGSYDEKDYLRDARSYSQGGKGKERHPYHDNQGYNNKKGDNSFMNSGLYDYDVGSQDKGKKWYDEADQGFDM